MSKFYHQAHADKMQCRLCQHGCIMAPGQYGLCGVNRNSGTAVSCDVYGYPSALAVDPIEKKPFFHLLPGSKSFSLGTVGCNFHCNFCQNWQLSQTRSLSKGPYYSPADIVTLARAKSCDSIAFTYNEPTIFYPYARDIAILAKEHALSTLFVTDGYESREVVDDMPGVIDALNVDLKSFNANYYKQALGGELHHVLENLERFLHLGLWVEVTTLVVPSKNDSEEELRAMARYIKEELGAEVPWHLSAFHPEYKAQTLPHTPLRSLQQAYEIAKAQGLKHVYIGNVKRDNATHCSACNTLLIERPSGGAVRSHLRGNRCPTCGHELAGLFKGAM